MNKRDFFLSCKECILENPRNFYGSFSLGPFQKSQGLTVANALRRTLFTELLNIAITHVEIDGVFHEYSTIEGVRESVLEILLNFKQLVLKTSFCLTKPIYGYLNVRGPGIIRISDLKLPPNIQYVDPDQYIATLNENGKLCLKVTISSFSFAFGQISPSGGYSQILNKPESGQKNTIDEKPSQKTKSDRLKNTKPLLVDANFNPILKVNYLIENFQPIQNSHPSEIVHIELWTNGSVHPRKALNFAIYSLKNMLDKFEDMEKVNSRMSKSFFESDQTLVKILKSIEYNLNFYSSIELYNSNVSLSNLKTLQEKSVKNAEVLSFGKPSRNSSIYVLNLPSRISQCLIKNNFLTIQDLIQYRAKEFKNFCGIGNFSLSLIQKKLKKMGFELKS